MKCFIPYSCPKLFPSVQCLNISSHSSSVNECFLSKIQRMYLLLCLLILVSVICKLLVLFAIRKKNDLETPTPRSSGLKCLLCLDKDNRCTMRESFIFQGLLQLYLSYLLKELFIRKKYSKALCYDNQRTNINETKL